MGALVIVLVTNLVASPWCGKTASANDIATRLNTEARKAWDEYLAFTSSMACSIQSTEWAQGPSGEVKTVQPSQRRHHQQWSVSTWQMPDGGWRAEGINSRYAFELERRPDAEPWFLTNLDRNPYRVSGSGQRTIAARFHMVVSPALRIYRGPVLPEMMREAGFAVAEVTEEIDANGVKLARVLFSYQPDPQDRNNPVRSGMMRLRIDDRWILDSFDVEGQWGELESGRIQGRFEYGGSVQGFLLPTKVRFEVHATNHDTKLATKLTNQFEYTWEPLKDPSEAEFQLTAFGLPEPGARPPSRNVPSWVWFLVASASLAVLAVFFRWRASRTRS